MTNLFDISQASFVTGVPLAPDSGWVAMALDDLAEKEIEHTAILNYVGGGNFAATCLKMFRTRKVLWLAGRSEVIFVGDNGECATIDTNGIDHDEYVTTSQRSPRNTGHIRTATRLGDDVIAVGMQRQVYRRNAAGVWRDMMAGIPEPGAEAAGFECVLALSEDEIYAAGWRGEIWIFEGRAWRRIETPTNLVLTAMALHPSGQVLVGGRQGLLLSGRRDLWQVINEGAIPTDIWSIDGSTGTVFVASLRQLFELKDVGADLLNPAGADSFGALSYNAGVLWSFGQKDFLELGGTGWRAIA